MRHATKNVWTTNLAIFKGIKGGEGGGGRGVFLSLSDGGVSDRESPGPGRGWRSYDCSTYCSLQHTSLLQPVQTQAYQYYKHQLFKTGCKYFPITRYLELINKSKSNFTQYCWLEDVKMCHPQATIHNMMSSWTGNQVWKICSYLYCFEEILKMEKESSSILNEVWCHNQLEQHILITMRTRPNVYQPR